MVMIFVILRLIQSLKVSNIMRFVENSIFDLENRNNLILDFYDYYYFFTVELENEELLPLVSDGYELFLEQILHGVLVLKDYSNSSDGAIDIIDYTTTLYGVLSSIISDDEIIKDTKYNNWIDNFKSSIEYSSIIYVGENNE